MQIFTKFKFPDFVFRKLLNRNFDRISVAYLGTIFLFLFICCATPMVVKASTNLNGGGNTPGLKTVNHKASFSFVLHGTIVDATDDGPLPGASILVKGTKNGATTDNNGKFIIEIPTEQDSIVVSYVGYKTQTFFVGTSKTMAIKLEPDLVGKKLNDVVVVGYGTQKKVTMVGSVSSVSVKEIQQYSDPQLTNAIAGKIAGVVTRQTSGEPGYDAAKIFIRGLASQQGSNKPLIIIDGVERGLQDYWSDTNIQEIESFSVLKDATSTAVFGTRGANGVIMITTKKGIAGKPKVTFRTEAAQMTPLRVEDNINGYEYALLSNESQFNNGLVPLYTAAQLQKYQDGSDPVRYPSVDWYDQVFRDHYNQAMSNLGIQGGTEFAKYYLNVGYTLQQGIYANNNNAPYQINAALNKYTFRSNIDLNLTKNFNVALGLAGSIKNNNTPAPSRSAIFDKLKLVSPLASPLINPNGSYSGVQGSDADINPLAYTTASGYNKQFYTTLTSNLSANWMLNSITPGLSVKGLVAYDVVDITQDIREQTPGTFQYNPDKNTYAQVKAETPLGFRTASENYKTIYGEVSLNYLRSFGKHNVSGLILGSRRDYTNVGVSNSILNLPNRRQSLAARVTYNYDSRYLLEANAGYSGSEQFPKGQRYGFFPSIGAGWVVSNEKFWNKKIVSTFKIRGSYGTAGNDAIVDNPNDTQRFLFLTTFNKDAPDYRFGINQDVDIQGKSELKIGNPNVTWETSYKANAGIDLEFLNGEIVFTGDLFHDRREGQLLRRAVVPGYTGYNTASIPYGNVGITVNRGFDGSLQYRHTTKSGFFYSLTGSFTLAKNKIIENDQPPVKYPWQDGRNHPIGSRLGYVALGLFKDAADVANSPSQSSIGAVFPGDVKFKDINGDNKIDDADRTIIGDYGTEPQIMFGFGTTVGWKGFDATVFFVGNGRRDFFMTDKWTALPFAAAIQYNVMQLVYDNRWIPGADNSNAIFPAVRSGTKNNYQVSTIYQRNAAYLRLRTAEIGYTLPAGIAKKIALRSARIFAQGTNLGTWDKIKVIDPESDNGTGSYPISQNYNFGIEITF